MKRFLTAFIISFVLGSALGVLGGWFLPLGQTGESDIDDLHPEFQAEYVVMVGQSYTLTNDWDAAQAQIGKLGEPDPPGYIVRLTENYISAGRNPDDIRALVRLAAQYGVVTEPMRPYLPAASP